MRRRSIITVLALVLALVALPAPAALAGTAEQFTVPFSGDQVVPGPGDPDGTGGVFVSLGRKSGLLCFFADTANISTPLTAVHLHRGARGATGDAVVQLYGASTDPDVSGCLDVGSPLIRDISKHRDAYYIDMHNEEFPAGAIRAQLG